MSFTTVQIHKETKELLKEFIVRKYGSRYYGMLSEVADKAISEYIRRHA